jgi:hypothetical protein
MAFQDGNQDAAYSIEEIKELAKLYCEHLAQGLSKQSFVDCCYTTIEDRIKKQPDVFQSEKREIEKSLRSSRKFWEEIGKNNIVNKEEMSRDHDGNVTVLKTSLNSAAWIFNMKNRFKDEWRDSHAIETTPQEITVTLSGPTPPTENLEKV